MEASWLSEVAMIFLILFSNISRLLIFSSVIDEFGLAIEERIFQLLKFYSANFKAFKFDKTYSFNEHSASELMLATSSI